MLFCRAQPSDNFMKLRPRRGPRLIATVGYLVLVALSISARGNQPRGRVRTSRNACNTTGIGSGSRLAYRLLTHKSCNLVKSACALAGRVASGLHVTRARRTGVGRLWERRSRSSGSLRSLMSARPSTLAAIPVCEQAEKFRPSLDRVSCHYVGAPLPGTRVDPHSSSKAIRRSADSLSLVVIVSTLRAARNYSTDVHFDDGVRLPGGNVRAIHGGEGASRCLHALVC